MYIPNWQTASRTEPCIVHQADSPPWQPTFLLLSCEHAGHDVPPEYRHLFAGAESTLATHRGFDIGIKGVALQVAARTAAPLILTTISRLFVEPNRSLGHPQLFSEFTRDLPEPERQAIIDTYYEPHRAGVTRTVDAAIRAGHRVAHVGVHSFTDVLDTHVRDVDLGLLFDPDVRSEVAVCTKWGRELERMRPDLRIRHNEPYRGIDDGLTTTLRALFGPHDYAGLEVEVRQGLILDVPSQRCIGNLLGAALAAGVPTLIPKPRDPAPSAQPARD